MFRLLPADYCDRQTGRCRISPRRFQELGLIVGQWVRLQSKQHEQDQIYCRVWPARYDCGDTVLVDRLIAKTQPLSEDGMQIKDNDRYDMTVIPSVAQKALRLQVIVSQIKIEGRDKEDGHQYDEASENQRRIMIQDALENQVVGSGFIMINNYRGILIKIESSVPATSDPILVTKGTMINILQEKQSADNSNSTLTTTSGSSRAGLGMEISQHLKILPGLEGPIKALLEVVSYPLLYPDLIARLNIECPKGILLHGPPGVGKTLLVSTVAQYCHAQMVTIYGPEIFGPYVGESEEKLRQKFGQASRMALENPKRPVIIFIDELDALTPHRTDAQAHESRVVAQLLTLMDGVTSRGRVVVIAATNRPNSIDPALRRPGRFDREIRMEVPGELDRAKIIRGLIKEMPHTLSEADLRTLARMTNGFVGADLEALCRESALNAVHREISSGISTSATNGSSVKVTLTDFKKAFKTNAPSLKRGYGVMVEPVRWTDIGGLEQVKIQLRQAVEWPVLYKNTFTRLGLKAPRGILLYGPPGCSKTTLVKAIATNSGASFLSVNGAALYSSYVGDSEKTVRETFHQARLSAPSIIFFDEIDTIVGKRNFSAGGSGGDSGGDSVQERVLSTMLNEMDGVENATGVLIVAATNRVDLIDKALLRPGRFDRVVPPPDLNARRQILGINTRDIPLADDVNLDAIAEMTEMYTGADLQNVCREAALIALRTRVLNAPLHMDSLTEKENATRMQEPVNANDFHISLATVKPSLTAAMLLEYSATGQRAF
ncbi:hypothetical protein FBU30_003993 [Linnemannia zychae]|nr:hypothetical protein FBU30_003993 [Linnemannia zychae]